MKKIFTIFAILSTFQIFAQHIPERFAFSADGRRLITGGDKPSTGIYDESSIKKVELFFIQPNFQTLLTSNYASKTRIPARMEYNGRTYDSVGVRYRGNTSYSRAPNKKSLSIQIDWVKANQDVEGYQTFHFNNAFEDPSFMREVLYLGFNRRHIPAAKGNYVHLYVNGANWGLYPNVQNLDGEFMAEWFLSNDGTRWRGEATGGGGGGGFGAGTSTLNFLGTDTTLYKTRYTLKNTTKAYPWQDLVNACRALSNPVEDSLKKVFDTDRALWFVGHEIVFGDDDSYVAKGGMDYYVFWDKETNRVTPIEYDGNSAMGTATATWTPFYNATNANFVIQNKLFNVPALRQRYLAHLRTMIEEDLDTAYCINKLNRYAAMIDTVVQNDPTKNYSYAQWQTDKTALRTFFINRKTNLLANTEINRPYPNIQNVTYAAGATPFSTPNAGQTVKVTANISFAAGISRVNLYYATGLDGYFEKVLMYDNGTNGDATAGDGIYTGNLPAYAQATYVRFYVEAVANDASNTVAYMPKGAEHDVYIYQVNAVQSQINSVTVNEIMAINQTGATDPNGQTEDWIELFNKTNAAVDISGLYLSDDVTRRSKWKFPANTTIPANGYLIVWTDEDGTQPGLHANFKLAGAGETVILSDIDSAVIDQVTYGQQRADFAYARRPNGTGNFVVQTPTFSANNNTGTSSAENLIDASNIFLFPNPTTNGVTIRFDNEKTFDINITNIIGQQMFSGKMTQELYVPTEGWASGVYLIKIGNSVVKKLMVH